MVAAENERKPLRLSTIFADSPALLGGDSENAAVSTVHMVPTYLEMVRLDTRIDRHT